MANEITKVTDKNNVDHPLRDAAAQTALTGILNGQSIDSFGDVESALEGKAQKITIAVVESGATASRAYAIGQHFIKDDLFCTATVAIASGDTLTRNTNYLAAELSEIMSSYFVPALSNIDLDNVKYTGDYVLSGGITHSPGFNYGYLTVKRNGGDYEQIARPVSSANAGEVFRRVYYQSTWTPWYKFTGTAMQ